MSAERSMLLLHPVPSERGLHADLHSGNTYRFDGWRRSPEMSRSGTDHRHGKKGRNKWVWWWERPASAAAERAS